MLPNLVKASSQMVNMKSKANQNPMGVVSNCQLNGKQLSKKSTDNFITDYSTFLSSNEYLSFKTPNLTVVNLDSEESTGRFIDIKLKQISKSKIVSTNIVNEPHCSKNQVKNLINNLNEDENVHGIIIQQPLPEDLKPYMNEMNSMIRPSKDVDCFHPVNLTRFNNKKEIFNSLDRTYDFIDDIRSGFVVPVPILSISQLLAHLNVNSYDKNVVILRDSFLVGSYAKKFFTKKGSNVEVINNFSNGLDTLGIETLKKADIVISDVNSKNLFNYNHLKKNAIVIDAGTYCDPTNGKIYGDFDASQLKANCNKKNIYYSPTPGGYGPISTAMLQRNLFACWFNQNIGKYDEVRKGY